MKNILKIPSILATSLALTLTACGGGGNDAPARVDARDNTCGIPNWNAEMLAQGIQHAIGTEKYPAPQATLMATLIKGILSFNLDWQYVFVGVFLAVVMELCGIKALSFAVGAYLPLSTTLPIFIGGAIKGLVDLRKQKAHIVSSPEDEELGKGSLFATGLVAGGAVAGVIIAFVSGSEGGDRFLKSISRCM
jgi:uncharacterized oligopeptide transporter (OPT) family protein